MESEVSAGERWADWSIETTQGWQVKSTTGRKRKDKTTNERRSDESYKVDAQKGRVLRHEQCVLLEF